MRTLNEKTPTSAQLTMHYQIYSEKLTVNNAQHASELFLQFAKSINQLDGWYVIFLDRNKQFKCWQNLENFCDEDAIAKDIAGFAKTIGAKHITMARIDNGRNNTIGYLDICWIAALLKHCQLLHLKLDDYLVITENDFCSYQDKQFID